MATVGRLIEGITEPVKHEKVNTVQTGPQKGRLNP